MVRVIKPDGIYPSLLESNPDTYCRDCTVLWCFKGKDGRYHYQGSTTDIGIYICERMKRRI